MKKFISAAASLAMAASMVSAAVPFATGAAASKSFEIRALNGASTTISADAIAAGDVTIPIGVFLKESAKDSDSITAGITVNSANGDASTVSFEAPAAGETFYAEAIDMVAADGQTYQSNKAVTFAGTLKSGRNGASFTAAGSGQPATAASYKTDVKYAYASYAWTKPLDGYSWTGAASDSFPIYYVNATFKKGTKAGTYTIDFADFQTQPDKSADIMSNMIEVGGNKLTSVNGGLSLGDSLTITIGDGGSPVETTAPPVATTVAPAATTVAPAKTTAPAGTNAPKVTDENDTYEKKPTLDGFIAYSGDWDKNIDGGELMPGDQVYVDVYVDSNNSDVAQIVAGLLDTDLPDGFSVVEFGELGIDGASFNKLGNWYYVNTLKGDGSARKLDDETYTVSFTVKVGENVQPGTYPFSLTRFTVATDGDHVYEATIKAGSFTVGGVAAETTAPPAVTTAPPVQTTVAPAVTTVAPVVTTEKATSAPGTPDYGDSNVDGKVNIADVVVLNKWLNDAKSYNLTDQGKLNADCCDPKNGTDINSNDSDAIIKSIVSLVTLPTTADKL